MDEIYNYLDILIYLGKKKKIFDTVKLSTIELSKELGSSQQTISRKLIEMEKSHLIERKSSQRGMEIKLTKKALDTLNKIREELVEVTDLGIELFTGRVQEGFGEGGYYVNQEGYQSQFVELLGFRAFAGTLNVKVNPVKVQQFLSGMSSILISGFKVSDRTFGKITCYPVVIRFNKKKEKCILIVPERTSHPKDIIEIISKHNLRKKLGLKENGQIKVIR